MANASIFAGIALGLALTGFALADEITDAIGDAQKAYQAGQLGAAKQSLDLASQLIAQKNAEGLVKAFPAPLKGWAADEADTSSGAFSAVTGSGASKRYTNGSDDSVSISIAADGPVVSQMVAVLANPQVAGMMGKIVRVADQRAIQDGSGDITVLVANRFIVKVDGSAKVDDKLAFARAVNYGFLQNFK